MSTIKIYSAICVIYALLLNKQESDCTVEHAYLTPVTGMYESGSLDRKHLDQSD